MQTYLHPFEPIVFEESEILILGSFPSLKSFEFEFYYAHPKNQFWRLLANIYVLPIETVDDKMKLLRVAKIALWDIVKNCDRVNSADTNLKNMQPNDIAELLIRYPNIKKIFFTGRTAEKLYKKHFYKLLLPSMLLPSPSPAYAAVKFEQKLRIWREALL